MKHLSTLFVSGLFAVSAMAQQEVIVVTDTVPGKDNQQKVITLRLKGEQADEKKYTIEIDGDKIKVNGKDVADLKDIEVSVGKNRMFFRNREGAPFAARPRISGSINGRPFTGDDLAELRSLNGMGAMGINDNKAFLGIGMEKTTDGVKVTDVTEGSAASKAGLKEGDVLVKLDGREVKAEMDVTKIVGAHKPGDEVDVVYKREGKEKKAKTTLGKREGGASAFWYNDGQHGTGEKFAPFNGEDFDFKLATPPGDFKLFHGEGDAPFTMNWSDSRPRLGVSIKETEEGKGLEVTGVDDNSAAAKAGLQKGDIVTEVGGKSVNSVDEVRKAVSENKDKPFTVKYTRNGKSMSAEVKFPKKLKQTDL